MHYVKLFNINGVDTKQVACIELQAPPNAATEGAVGVLGMDMSSPTHEVYRCVAVNGSVYTWELLSAGMSIVSARITKEGATSTSFAYEDLKIPTNYLIKSGDLILDSDGYLYQVSFIGGDSCNATYCGTHLGGAGASDKDYRLVVEDGTLRLVTENGNVLSEIDFLTSDEKTIHRDPSTGKASVMAIKTVDGGLLHIFVGTQAEYEKLTEAQKQNLFAIITDDTVPKFGTPTLNSEKKLTEPGYYHIQTGIPGYESEIRSDYGIIYWDGSSNVEGLTKVSTNSVNMVVDGLYVDKFGYLTAYSSTIYYGDTTKYEETNITGEVVFFVTKIGE